MKHIIPILIICLLILTSCGTNSEKDIISTDIIENPNTASGKKEKDVLPKFEFEKNEHDFGKVIEGEKVSYTFVYKNVGKSDLVIFQAKASCGCTVPNYSKYPIEPGETGKIIITFNSNKRKGFQNKIITLVANTQPNTYVLRIKCLVIQPEK